MVTVFVCVIFRIRLPLARCWTSSFNKSSRRRNPLRRAWSSSSPSSSDGGGDESGEGGEGAAGRCRSCFPAILGRVLGVVTVDVVVDVPAPARRRAGTVVLLAGTVVVAVTGRVLVDSLWWARCRRHVGGGRGDWAYSGGRDGSCLGGGSDWLCCSSGRRRSSHPCHR